MKLVCESLTFGADASVKDYWPGINQQNPGRRQLESRLGSVGGQLPPLKHRAKLLAPLLQLAYICGGVVVILLL